MFAIGSVKEDFLGSVVLDSVNTQLTGTEHFDPVNNYQDLRITRMHRDYIGRLLVSAWSRHLITYKISGISNGNRTGISIVH